MTSADLPGIMFAGLCCEKYLLAIAKYINGTTRLPVLCAGEAPDENNSRDT